MLTKKQIQFLDKACPNKWEEENGVINGEEKVDIAWMKLPEIPVQFGRVIGDFDCACNALITLKGTPYYIADYFNCNLNQLTTLEGGPKEVYGSYSCILNKLSSLVGAPEICNGVFLCYENQLTSLKGCPKVIKGNLRCQKNPNLKYLCGIGRVELEVHYDNHNEINEWIIECMKRDIIFPHFTLEENIDWIKREQKYSCLLDAPQEIRQYFSPRILHLADSGFYNESKILDYKKFSRIC